MKPTYDRHRRIRKRHKITYRDNKYQLEAIKTWGQIFIAKREAKEYSDFFNFNDHYGEWNE